nr:MAG TPA: hypothetical protein [Caudoviricetes sp.]
MQPSHDLEWGDFTPSKAPMTKRNDINHILPVLCAHFRIRLSLRADQSCN